MDDRYAEEIIEQLHSISKVMQKININMVKVKSILNTKRKKNKSLK